MSASSRDITGVPTAELAVVYAKYADCDYETMAERIGMDVRLLKDIVVTQNYAFTGITVADRIVTFGLGESFYALTAEPDPELHIVVNWGRAAAREYIQILHEIQELPPPKGKDMEALIDSHLARREELCARSAAQEERMERERARARDRQRRLRATAA